MDEKVKQDFPIDWEGENYVSRREFFKYLVVSSAGLAFGSVALAAWAAYVRDPRHYEPALVARTGDVPVGGAIGFNYPRPHDICILAQPEPGVFVAYSRRCTHLSCPVDFQPGHNKLYCPCHNAAFSIEDGSVLYGPAPHALPRVVLEIRDDQIYAIGVVREGDME